MKANIYDFDGTIYDGDSSVDFFIFCFKKKKSICRCFPKMFWYLILYALSIKTKTEMKEVFFSFLKYFDKTEELVDEFWDKNYYKVKALSEYLKLADDMQDIEFIETFKLGLKDSSLL